ncbi:MAG: hypothetical protein GDA54_05780 [Alphaproteobacteria bacterium GM7ARS4]|nr:hypothetical protein [Alphaproteobacteria bacterium GM7ARS4]
MTHRNIHHRPHNRQPHGATTRVEHLVFLVEKQKENDAPHHRQHKTVNNVQFVFKNVSALEYRHCCVPQWLYIDHGDIVTEGFKTTFPRNRRILIVTEPLAVRQYDTSYFNQFGIVLSSYKPGKGFDGVWLPSPIYLQQAYVMSASEKTKIISAICSQKRNRNYHRQRLRFVESLKEEMGDKLDVFGRDSNPIPKKRDGIVPYRYHIVLENCRHPHYWSEKLSDAYMGEAYPFYSGCPNLYDYFPRDSYTPIDIFNIQQSVDTVATLSASTLWLDKRHAVAMAKKRLLHQHNRLSVLSHIVKKLAYALPREADTPCAPCTISHT